MKLVIVIPAYNEEETIVEVIKGIPSAFFGIAEKEIIVIDDGSTDQTTKLAREAGALVVSYAQNRGVGAAFSTGLNQALTKRADIMVTIDADSQFDGQDILKLIQPILAKEADFVSGSRFLPGALVSGMPKLKLFGNKAMTKFINFICQSNFSDVSCGFRAYNKKALCHLNLFGQFTYTQEVILNLSLKNLRMQEVPIKVKYLSERKSVVSGKITRYIFQSLRIIFRTIIDYQPLKFFGRVGIFIFLIGLILDLIMLYIFLQTGQFTPYKFVGIFGIIFNIFGLVFLTIGFMAELINRLRQNQERMLYYLKKGAYYG